MTKTYAYVRSPQSDTVGQTTAIEDYCESHGLAIEGYHVDVHTSGNTPMAARDAGKRLLDQLNEGDQVVIDVYCRLARDP